MKTLKMDKELFGCKTILGAWWKKRKIIKYFSKPKSIKYCHNCKFWNLRHMYPNQSDPNECTGGHRKAKIWQAFKKCNYIYLDYDSCNINSLIHKFWRHTIRSLYLTCKRVISDYWWFPFLIFPLLLFIVIYFAPLILGILAFILIREDTTIANAVAGVLLSICLFLQLGIFLWSFGG